MPNVWVVVALIERADGRRKKDTSAPTTYTRAAKEIERLARLKVKASMKQVEAPPAEPKKKPEEPRAVDERQAWFGFMYKKGEG